MEGKNEWLLSNLCLLKRREEKQSNDQCFSLFLPLPLVLFSSDIVQKRSRPPLSLLFSSLSSSWRSILRMCASFRMSFASLLLRYGCYCWHRINSWPMCLLVRKVISKKSEQNDFTTHSSHVFYQWRSAYFTSTMMIMITVRLEKVNDRQLYLMIKMNFE